MTSTAEVHEEVFSIIHGLVKYPGRCADGSLQQTLQISQTLPATSLSELIYYFCPSDVIGGGSLQNVVAGQLIVLNYTCNNSECSAPKIYLGANGSHFFLSGGKMYHVLPNNQICSIISWEQWLVSGGPAGGNSNFPYPSNYRYVGQCGLTSDSNLRAPNISNVLTRSSSQILVDFGDSGPEAVGYLVAIAAGNSPPGCTGINVGNVHFYTFNNLSPHTAYSISICGVDAHGNVSPATSVSATTGCANAAVNVSGMVTSAATGLPIVGAMLTLYDNQSRVETTITSDRYGHYKAGLLLSVFANSFSEKICAKEGSGTLSCQTVSAIDTCVVRNFTANFSLSDENLRAPNISNVTAISSTKIQANFSGSGSDAKAYLAAIAKGSAAPGCSGLNVGKVETYTFNNLSPNTQYTLSICAIDANGNVTPASSYHAVTLAH